MALLSFIRTRAFRNEHDFLQKLNKNSQIKTLGLRVHNTIVVHSLPKGPIQVSMIFSCS